MESPPEFWHFGDSDPGGFQILADLRERSGLDVKAFHMDFRPCSHAAPLTSREVALVRELVGRTPTERAALEAPLATNNKGDFEQESLKPPSRTVWPFYP
ncbi:MAG: hypothetical protein Fur0032_04530 [Terrimicrobiaceae bacterium]